MAFLSVSEGVIQLYQDFYDAADILHYCPPPPPCASYSKSHPPSTLVVSQFLSILYFSHNCYLCICDQVKSLYISGLYRLNEAKGGPGTEEGVALLWVGEKATRALRECSAVTNLIPVPSLIPAVPLVSPSHRDGARARRGHVRADGSRITVTYVAVIPTPSLTPAQASLLSNRT